MMTPHSIFTMIRRGSRMATGASILLVAAACSSLLDVKNPNNVAESALSNPAAAAPEANGALASTTRALGFSTLVYAEATDEMDWIGSRDSWNELDKGVIGNFANEFSDDQFKYIAEARYVADQAIIRLEAFDKAGQLTARADLMRSYIYAAVVYTSIADMYDDFAFSNKTVAAAPFGRANMGQLYDAAVGYLDKALAIATANGDKYTILAMRARTKHGKAVWAKVTPKSAAAPSNPLVRDAGAVADATAAIPLAGPDASFDLINNVEATSGTNIWYEVNARNESAPGKTYSVDPLNTTNKYVAALIDPISQTADLRIQARLLAFKAFGTSSGTLWITNTRELRLILAEDALAGGNTAEFTSQINTVRALDGKPLFTGQISNTNMLAYERQAQLWLMRRRLMDMARFGVKDPKWTSSASYDNLFSSAGLLFPIANVERQANPCIADATKCK